MGAPNSYVRYKRILKALSLKRNVPGFLCFLGDEFLGLKEKENVFIIPGKNTKTSLQCFAGQFSDKKDSQIYVVSAWYHLLRCRLILRKLGFKNVKMIISDFRIWNTDARMIFKEIRSLVSQVVTSKNLRRTDNGH